MGPLDGQKPLPALIVRVWSYTGAGSDDAESVRTIHRALELRVTFLDIER